MKMGQEIELLEKMAGWQPPLLPEQIPHGDMPGDKINIAQEHIIKAEILFRKLGELLPQLLQDSDNKKAVITVCGGSGVGKSEIASLLSFYFNKLGIGSYTLSGDNYVRRIPMYNDAERLRVFREAGLRSMLKRGTYTADRFQVIKKLQEQGKDADPQNAKQYSWFSDYLSGGRERLECYLGTPEEINFAEMEKIVWEFKEGREKIWLKRMGRDDTELWFEEVDFSNTNLLIIEWTHGNSDFYQGVDIPVFLNSTPQETLAHRKVRNRDGMPDNPFTMLVLDIEQHELEKQACKAKLILSKQGELLTCEQYFSLLGKGENDVQ